MAIIGASGSGKSTLFHILGGLTPMTSGTVQINGRDLSDMTNAERTDLRKTTVGFVFQKYNLLPTLTAEDNIRMVQSYWRPPYDVRSGVSGDSAVARDLRQVEAQASRALWRPAAEGGDCAGGIVNSPAILLADEPTGQSGQ